MFNWSLKLRQQTKYCVPQGPSFGHASQLKFAVEGTTISLYAPKHRSKFASNKAIQPPREIQLSHIVMKPARKHSKRWEYHDFVTRSWSFYGPWFSGFKSELSMGVTIITPDELNIEASFFRPKAFEHALADYLQDQYADAVYEGIQEWLAPSHWKVVNSLPCVAASFYVNPNTYNTAGPERYFIFPVSNKHLVKVFFSFTRNCAGSNEEQDKQVGMATMEQLSTDIINSIEIKLSPEAQAQQAKALADCEDVTLSESFPPLKWTSPEQDAEYERYLEEEQRIQDMLNNKVRYR